MNNSKCKRNKDKDCSVPLYLTDQKEEARVILPGLKGMYNGSAFIHAEDSKANTMVGGTIMVDKMLLSFLTRIGMNQVIMKKLLK